MRRTCAHAALRGAGLTLAAVAYPADQLTAARSASAAVPRAALVAAQRPSATTLASVAAPVAVAAPQSAGRVDCNGNAIPDECDVSCAGACAAFPNCGQRPDGNGNGVPDECEVVGIPRTYLIDDASAEYGLRSAPAGGQTAWLNQFDVADGAALITGIQAYFVNIPDGRPAKAYLWSDPDGDRDPTDAQVLASAVVATPSSVFLNIDIPDTYIGPNGTSFFVGLIMPIETANDFPAPLDASPPTLLGRSWTVGSAASSIPTTSLPTPSSSRCSRTRCPSPRTSRSASQPSSRPATATSTAFRMIATSLAAVVRT